MATLAQEILETTWRPRASDVPSAATLSRTEKIHYENEGLEALEIVRGALRAPALGASSDQMDCHAERYVFDCDGPDQVAQMIEDGMIGDTVPFETAEMPAPIVWIEWRVGAGRAPETIKVGVLLSASHGDNIVDPKRYCTRIIGCVSTKRSLPSVLFVGYGPSFPPPQGLSAQRNWDLGLRWLVGCILLDDDSDLSIRGEVEVIAREAITCLFLLTTPRVCSYREVEWGAKLQAKRRTNGKLPLVEYREVKVLVGTSEVRNRRIGTQAPASSPEAAAKRLLHRVIGHFRVYERDGKKRAIWIAQHLRGDAGVGILLHNRTISGGKKT